MTNNDVFDTSVFIVTENGDVVMPGEYEDNDGNPGQFIMVTSDVLNSDYGDDNTMFIYRHNLFKAMHKVWQSEPKLIPNIVTIKKSLLDCDFQIEKNTKRNEELILKHLNGYKQTQDILLNVENENKPLEDYIPAIMIAINSTATYKGQTIHGYLPSVGQMIILSQPNTICLINDALIEMGEDEDEVYGLWEYEDDNFHIHNALTGTWWTSTQNDFYYAWAIGDGVSYYVAKSDNNKAILPLFLLKI